MAVNLNTVGNYSAYNIAQKNNSQQGRTGSENTVNGKISSDEKEYFAGLYPSSKNEIMDYSFYERSGRMNGVSVGTKLDRRG